MIAILPLTAIALAMLLLNSLASHNTRHAH
jgi:hypothetical protein